MPDISMCANEKCSLRMGCYRYRAVPNEFRQSYGTFYPVQEKCNYYWPVSEAPTPVETIKNIEIMENESKQDSDKQI